MKLYKVKRTFLKYYYKDKNYLTQKQALTHFFSTLILENSKDNFINGIKIKVKPILK